MELYLNNCKCDKKIITNDNTDALEQNEFKPSEAGMYICTSLGVPLFSDVEINKTL